MPIKASPSRRFIIVDNGTIREARDREEEKKSKVLRSRKRARVADSDDDEEETDKKDKLSWSDYDQKGPYERDPVYWSEDPSATCYARVRDVMFKFHHELLSCCELMRECLQDHIDRNGPPTEEKPYQCPYPTVAEYRAFMWALHASMDELNEPPKVHSDLERLSLIVDMTRKYDIPQMDDWVREVFDNLAVDNVFMDSCSSASITLLLDLAIRCNRERMQKAVINKWRDRLLNKSTPSVPAIQAADKYDLGELRGIAYYVHVQDMLDRQTFTAKGATQLRADPKLNNGQVMRLLTGYCSLVSLWERLRLKPIELPLAKSCSADTHAKCTSVWERRWISAVGWKRILGISSADIIALLACLRDQLSNDDDLKAGLNSECRLAGLEALKTLRTNTQQELADHFFACV